MGNHVVGVDDLDIVGNHDIRSTNNTFTFFAQLQHHLIAVMQLENDPFEVQENINYVFLYTVDL